MLDRRFRMNLMRMAMIAVVITTEIFCEHRNATRNGRRGRENRSRRQKSGFHFCVP
jgi:hypothetical protein